MRFESIDIKNYRQYKDLHFTFPECLGRDLHVIVGSNGVGKTNLLNAINWCLYGDEPHLGDEDDSLSIGNLTAAEQAMEEGKADINVSVVIKAANNDEKLEYNRSCTMSTETHFVSQTSFKVTITHASGDSDILYDEQARDCVNRYIPRSIREYFFFDGEQLHNYFGSNRETTHIKDSIYEIAQINVVETTKRHLKSFVDEYQRELSKLNPDLSDVLDEIKRKSDEKANYQEQVASLKTAVSFSTSEIERLSGLIAGSEHLVEDQHLYEENERDIEDAELKLKELVNELYRFFQKYYILLSFYRVNSSTKEYIDEKYQSGKLPPDINADLIRQSLESHACAMCGQIIPSEVEHRLQHLLEQFTLSTKASHKLVEIKNDVERFVYESSQYYSEKEAILKQIREVNQELKKKREENERLILKLRVNSSIDNLEDWINEREQHKNLIPINTEKIASYENQISALSKTLDELEEKKQKCLDAVSKSEDIKSNLSFVSKAYKIVTDIETEIVSEVRSEMEQETMDIFNQLIWKKNTYGRISLDENYKLKLYHKITNESCLGSCSAAERELLALAFTIALHHVSGHDNLLFIDTPVGRVSDENREYFAKKLIEVSNGKQLILAFTPSEFSEEIRKYFTERTVASFNQIRLDNEESTEKEEGIKNGR